MMLLRSLKPIACIFAVATLAACSQSAETPSTPPPASAASAPPPMATPEVQTTATQIVAPNTTTSKQAVTVPVAAGKAVNVYMYSEYIDPDMLKQFEAQTGMHVNLSVYEDTEEMMAKVQATGGAGQYDVIVASDHIIPVMKKLKLIQPLDATQFPNSKNVMTRFANPAYDRGSEYSLPYQWGTMGIMLNKQLVPKYDESWSLLLDTPHQPGTFILIDSMRDMFAAALKFQGHSINTKSGAELKAAAQLIQAAKATKNCLGFEGGAGGKNRVADGSAALAIVYNGDAVKAVEDDKDKKLVYFVPKEGTLIWVDAMVLPAQAPNPAGAYAFINYILDAKAGAQLSNFNKYATPNQASLPFITPEDRANIGIYPTEAQMAKMDFLEDVGDATRLYDETWTAIKAK